MVSARCVFGQDGSNTSKVVDVDEDIRQAARRASLGEGGANGGEGGGDGEGGEGGGASAPNSGSLPPLVHNQGRRGSARGRRRSVAAQPGLDHHHELEELLASSSNLTEVEKRGILEAHEREVHVKLRGLVTTSIGSAGSDSTGPGAELPMFDHASSVASPVLTSPAASDTTVATQMAASSASGSAPQTAVSSSRADTMSPANVPGPLLDSTMDLR